MPFHLNAPPFSSAFVHQGTSAYAYSYMRCSRHFLLRLLSYSVKSNNV